MTPFTTEVSTPLWALFMLQAPRCLAGKPDQADFQFKEAFEISESKYLMWHYLYARYYAFAINDRALFVATLEKVISAPDDILPEETFVTMAVKAKAKNLLTHTDDYFLAK